MFTLKKYSSYVFIAGLAVLPAVASAQEITDFKSLVAALVGMANSLVPVIFSIAGIVFIWGIVKFIAKADSEAERAKGKQLMIWGIVGLAVMMSVWGLALLLKNSIFPCANTPFGGGSGCASEGGDYIPSSQTIPGYQNPDDPNSNPQNFNSAVT
jgi:hypothetical protein